MPNYSDLSESSSSSSSSFDDDSSSSPRSTSSASIIISESEISSATSEEEEEEETARTLVKMKRNSSDSKKNEGIQKYFSVKSQPKAQQKKKDVLSKPQPQQQKKEKGKEKEKEQTKKVIASTSKPSENDNQENLTTAELLELTDEPLNRSISLLLREEGEGEGEGEGGKKPSQTQTQQQQQRKKKTIRCKSCGQVNDHYTPKCPLNLKSKAEMTEEAPKITEMDNLTNLLLIKKRLDLRILGLFEQKKIHENDLKIIMEELEQTKKRKVENQVKINDAYHNLGVSIIVNGKTDEEQPVSPSLQSPKSDLQFQKEKEKEKENEE